MSLNRRHEPFNWKRSLLLVLGLDLLFGLGFILATVTGQAGAREAAIGGLAVALICTLAIGIFGPLFGSKQ